MEEEGACSMLSSCVNCTLAGCNWCFSGMSTSRCTAETDSVKAKCDMATCATDKFILKTPDCYGGCAAAESCHVCSLFIGCGWCHESQKCQEVITQERADAPTCRFLTVGTCDRPCGSRSNCFDCTHETSCSWCDSDQSCTDSTNSTKTCSTKCPGTEDVTTPNKPIPAGASQIVASLVAVLCLFLAAF